MCHCFLKLFVVTASSFLASCCSHCPYSESFKIQLLKCCSSLKTSADYYLPVFKPLHSWPSICLLWPISLFCRVLSLVFRYVLFGILCVFLFINMFYRWILPLPLQAMHLVYRALEKEPVPSVLPPSLIPPSKRKKAPAFPGAVPVLPASPPPKDSLRSTPSHGSVNSLNSTGSLSPKHSIKQAQVQVSCFVFNFICRELQNK